MNSNKHSKTKALEFTNLAQADDVRNEIKGALEFLDGKAIAIDTDKNTIENCSSYLPDEVRASVPEEVRYVFRMRNEFSSAGKY